MPRSPARTLGLAALGVCSVTCARDTTPPEIVEARFEDASTLIVSFSEPIGPVADVDPSSHFRIGVGFDLAALGLTAYYDLANHFPYGVPGQGGSVPDAWPRHGNNLVARVDPTDDPTQLRLTLSYPMEPYACEILEQAAALDVPSGLHLHYAEAGYPRVSDEAGNPLADHGPSWVAVVGSATTVDGSFPELDVRMPIPCP